MKEEQRISLTKKIKEEEQQLEKLKAKVGIIKELKKHPAVMEYLQLLQEIRSSYDDISLATKANIFKKYAQESKEQDCQDEFLIRRGIGNKSLDNYFFQLDNYEGKEYYYSCLDCQKSFIIAKKGAANFEQGKKVIKAEGMNISEFYDTRARYLELLMNHSSLEAFMILKSEIEQKGLTRN